MSSTHDPEMASSKSSRDIAAADSAVKEKLATEVEHHEEIINEAAIASSKEREMGVLEALKAYPTACLYSIAFSTAIIMEGFDFTLINSFYALPAFQKRFGDLQPDGNYLIPPAWQSGLSNAVQVGSIIGLLINGWACDRWGYRKTIGISLVCMAAFIAVTFTAVRIEVLLIGEFLCGMPWGVFQTLTTAYAAEISPPSLRPFLTTYVNLCWVLGQFISSGVLKGVSGYDIDDEWSYRIPFALQWMWPGPILVAVYFAPESPWFLVRSGRMEEAKASLRRLGSRNTATAVTVDESLALIVATNEVEKAMDEGTSYLDTLRGTNRRRTEITCMTWGIQVLCGSGFIGFSTVFFQQAGLSTSDAFSMTLGNYALGAVGTISSWFTLNYFGRRELYLYGLVAMTIALLGVGGTGFIDSTSASWAAGSLVIVFSFIYQFTVGPVCYCIVSEIPSTRLRAKTVALARITYNLFGIVVSQINNVIFPNMLSPISWNWGRKAGFFWAGGAFLSAVWTFFRLPEPKGRSFVELDVLFDDRVSARKFSSTNVEVLNETKGAAPTYIHGGAH